MKWDYLYELAKAATPGPWIVRDWENCGRELPHMRTIESGVEDDGGGRWLCKFDRMRPGETEQQARDQDYIAAANPAVVMQLMEERNQLRQQLVMTDRATGGMQSMSAEYRMWLGGCE
jgi:hypothetical protein